MDAAVALAGQEPEIGQPEAVEAPGDARLFKTGLMPLAQAFGAGFFTLSASLANFLVHQGYPLLRVDVAIAFGIVAGACLLATLVYGVMPRRIRLFMEAVLVVLLVDINFTGSNAAYAVGIVFLAGLFHFRRSSVGLLSVFGAIVLATTVAGVGGSDGWLRTVRSGDGGVPAAAKAGRPAIVHLLMDEHLGLAGFPRDAAGRRTAAELRDFYVGHGFRIYPRAYSRYMHTVNAIPDLLNFGGSRPLSSNKNGMEVGPTRYFKRLDELGYALSIYQSDFGEFCSGATHARCVEYDSASLVPLIGKNFTTGERVTMILGKFLSLVESLIAAENLYIRFFAQQVDAGGDPFPPLSFSNKTSAVAATDFLDRLEDDLAHTKPGHAVFVHALYPHYPYVSEADCRMKPASRWRHRRDWTSPAERRLAYYDQVRCAMQIVDRLTAALDRSPVAGNYVMIVHGDHGSRITGADPLAGDKTVAQEDMLASFSTLFAVKLAAGAGGTDDNPVLASNLLRSLTLNEFQQFPVTNSQSSPSVILDDVNWQPKEERAFSVDW